MSNVYRTRQPAVIGNNCIRTPQQEAYAALEAFGQTNGREAGVVLPVGCGKSGCIALAPFAFRAGRVLVVAPGLRIAQQLYKDFDPSRADMFYLKTQALTGQPFPEPVEIRGTTTNRGDLDEAEAVITNIQQLQGEQNRWLNDLPQDYFDLILFDEGHHSVAATWQTLKTYSLSFA
jgi:superfamily II DNA or RNA helicase